MKYALKITAIVLAVLIFAVGVFALWMWGLYQSMTDWRTTEDVAEYGIIQWNGDNEIPEKFIKSFFPEQIEPYFENVTYKYKALDWCSYNCEIYLEFTIEDQKVFREFVDEHTKGITPVEFAYDPAFDDYVIKNDLYIDVKSQLASAIEEENYFFDYGAEMGRILVDEDSQQIIFTAICVYRCCGGDTDDYDFYSRFDIDPLEYSDRFCEKK